LPLPPLPLPLFLPHPLPSVPASASPLSSPQGPLTGVSTQGIQCRSLPFPPLPLPLSLPVPPPLCSPQGPCWRLHLRLHPRRHLPPHSPHGAVSAMYCTVFHCIVLCCTVLYSHALCCIVLCCTVLYCTVFHCSVLYGPVQYCTVSFPCGPHATLAPRVFFFGRSPTLSRNSPQAGACSTKLSGHSLCPLQGGHREWTWK